MAAHLGLIGGSGLCGMALEDVEWCEAAALRGRPSDAIMTGRLVGVTFSFLPRHGRDLACRLPVRLGDHPCADGCDRALDHAIMTAPNWRDPALLARLRTVAGRVP